MPLQESSIWIKLKKIYEEKPLLFSIIAALIIRLIASWINYGPAAIDDYENIIAPALMKIQINGIIDTTANKRFEIFPYMFYLSMKPLQLMGIDNPRYLVSAAYTVLSLLSLFGIWGMHKLGALYLEEKWQKQLTLISAIYFLTPLIMTKAYLGTYAIISMPWAFYYLGKKNATLVDYFWGSFCLAMTTFFRYQVSLIFFFAVIYLIIMRKERLKAFAGLFLGGFSMLIIIAFFEIVMGRSIGETILSYLQMNILSNVVSQDYGNAPWHTYLGILLTIFIPPFSIMIFYASLRNLHKAWLISGSVILFVFIHSLIGNKLERFLFPILPLFFLLSYIGIQNFWQNRWLRLSYKSFFIVNLIALPFATIASSQMSVVDGAIYMSSLKKRIYLEHPLPAWKKAYYGYQNKPLEYFNKKVYLLHKKIIQDNDQFYFFSVMPMKERYTRQMDELNIQCTVDKIFWPSPLEQLVIYLNPGKNKRRRESYLYLCTGKSENADDKLRK